jgi:hypothetical protein
LSITPAATRGTEEPPKEFIAEELSKRIVLEERIQLRPEASFFH